MSKPKQSAAAKARVPLTADLIDEILERIAQGEAVHAICNSEPDRFPTHSTVFEAFAKDAALADKYARAREMRAASLAEQTIAIADDLTEDANSRRIRVDARKWFASKLDPKRWGDKQTIETSGPNGGPIKQESRIEVVVVDANH